MFMVHVLTEAAAQRLPAAELISLKKIVLEHYSWTAVSAAIQEILSDAVGPDWESIARKLVGSFDWEFDNYQPYQARLP